MSAFTSVGPPLPIKNDREQARLPNGEVDEWLAQARAGREAASAIRDPDGELRAIRAGVDALRRRLDVVFWRYQGPRDRPASDAIEEAIASMEEAGDKVRAAIDAEPLTDEELRFEAICAANDARRGDVA